MINVWLTWWMLVWITLLLWLMRSHRLAPISIRSLPTSSYIGLFISDSVTTLNASAYADKPLWSTRFIGCIQINWGYISKASQCKKKKNSAFIQKDLIHSQQKCNIITSFSITCTSSNNNEDNVGRITAAQEVKILLGMCLCYLLPELWEIETAAEVFGIARSASVF